jgi:hypothetical protein
MPIRLVTAPASEPVTLAEAKAHLRLDTSLDDAFVASIIVAARQYIERVCWRGLLLQTWELTLGGFRGADRFDLAPDWRPSTQSLFTAGSPVSWEASGGAYRFMPYLELPRGHLATAPNVAITYLDENGASQTLSTSVYLVEGAANDSMLGRIWLNTAGGFQWPNTLSQFNAVKVQFTVGWDDAAHVPEPLKHAIKIVLAQLYEHRTPEIDGRLSEAQFTSTVLCGPWRMMRI